MFNTSSYTKNVIVLFLLAAVASSLSIISFQYSREISSEIRKAASEDIIAHAEDESFDLSRIIVNKIDSVTTNLEVLASAPSIQSGRPQGIDQLFDAAQYSTEELTEYYMWLDSDGSIVSASNIARASYQYNSMWKSEKPPFLTEPQKTASIYYSSIVHSPTDSVDRLYISYPIVNASQQGENLIGDFRGVIVASIRIDVLGSILTNELSPTFESDASLADISGQMIYSVESSAIGKSIIENPVYLTAPILNNLNDDISAKVTEFVKSTNTDHRNQLISINVEGKTITIASYPIIQKGMHFWTLYIIAPHVFTDNVDALLAEQDTYTTMTLAIIVAAAIGLGYLFLLWNKRLEATVKRRTIELNKSNASLLESNAQLQKANEQLKVHAKLQREFVNIAAHELRTPIMPILGIAELLEAKFRHSEIDEITLKRSDFEILSRNSRRLERLANDILDVSRIDTQSMHLNIESFDLYDLIQNTVNDIKNQFPNYKVEYDVLAEKGLYLSADKSKIGQVLWNLLSNATKFTDEGKITVACKIDRQETRGQDMVTLSVSDTGIGIDPDIMPRLFTKFTNKTRPDRDQVGSGLGLYISKGIVEAHGGKIWAEKNADGKGCTFWIQIPFLSAYERTQNQV
ncbi:MAG TPA: sensor histidine kinase [Nitrososphaera sp.]